MAGGRINGVVNQQGGSYSYYIDWLEEEIDTNKNTSVVKAWVHISCSAHNAYQANCVHDLYINGVHFANTCDVRLSAGVDIEVVSGQVVVPHESDGSRMINISANSTLPSGNGWGPAGGSAGADVWLEQIPRFANLTNLYVANRTIDSITLGYSTDKVARLFAHLNNGENWLLNGRPFVDNTTSGSFTINYKDRASTKRLEPGTTYRITVLCRNVENGLDTAVDIVATTKDIARITKVSSVNFGEDVNLTFSNLENETTRLTVKIENEEICTRDNLTSSYKLSFTKQELSKMIKLLKDETTQITYIVTTNDTYAATATSTIVLKTNIYIKVDGEWKKARLYKKQDVWKVTRLFLKSTNEWKVSH